MTSHDAVEATHRAVAALETAVQRVSREYGATLGVRRLTSDVERLRADLHELGKPAPGHRPEPAPEDLEEIPDEPYDESMWSDADDTEGYGVPGRHLS